MNGIAQRCLTHLPPLATYGEWLCFKTSQNLDSLTKIIQKSRSSFLNTLSKHQNYIKTDGMAQDAKFGINLDILSIFVSLNAF
jgi:hypothetical protein